MKNSFLRRPQPGKELLLFQQPYNHEFPTTANATFLPAQNTIPTPNQQHRCQLPLPHPTPTATMSLWISCATALETQSSLELEDFSKPPPTPPHERGGFPRLVGFTGLLVVVVLAFFSAAGDVPLDPPHNQLGIPRSFLPTHPPLCTSHCVLLTAHRTALIFQHTSPRHTMIHKQERCTGEDA